MPPFIIFALPRSRTAWLSRFLTYGDHVCGHEALRHMRSMDDVRAWFAQPDIGTAETAAAPWWRLLDKIAPDARVLVVRRPLDQVVDSLMRLEGVALDREQMAAGLRRFDRKLDQIEARVANVMSVRFEDLEKEATCAAVFEHCLPHKHDHDHWESLNWQNIQIDMRAMMRYYQAYQGPLTKLGKIAKHHILTDMALREPVSSDGIVIQAESFETWLRDAIPLFNEHLVQVGEAPGDWQAKNLPLMRDLAALGTMQIMTARCNGRMFGYLMSLIAPSLVSENITSAVHTTFFASPQFRGLGLKLQRAAAHALKLRGVDEVVMQDGVRGSGGRISALYRRMGAQFDGEMYRLQLRGA